jgi:hypothetical protein
MPEIGATSAASRRPTRAVSSDVERGARGVQRAGADELLRRQAFVVGVGALGLRQRGARALQHGVAFGHAGVQLGQFQPAQHLSGAHPAAFGHVQRQQRAAGLGAHQRRLRRHQRARELHPSGQARQAGLHHLARHELQRHLGLAVLALALVLVRRRAAGRGHRAARTAELAAQHQATARQGRHRQRRGADDPLLLHVHSSDPSARMALGSRSMARSVTARRLAAALLAMNRAVGRTNCSAATPTPRPQPGAESAFAVNPGW